MADAAHEANVRHVVYGSAGTGAVSWEFKLEIEAHMRWLELPLTVLRPVAFMELMTDKSFFPPISTWHVVPKLLGGSTLVPWTAVDDLAAVAAVALAERERCVGRDLPLVTDRAVDRRVPRDPRAGARAPPRAACRCRCGCSSASRTPT